MIDVPAMLAGGVVSVGIWSLFVLLRLWYDRQERRRQRDTLYELRVLARVQQDEFWASYRSTVEAYEAMHKILLPTGWTLHKGVHPKLVRRDGYFQWTDTGLSYWHRTVYTVTDGTRFEAPYTVRWSVKHGIPAEDPQFVAWSQGGMPGPVFADYLEGESGWRECPREFLDALRST